MEKIQSALQNMAKITTKVGFRPELKREVEEFNKKDIKTQVTETIVHVSRNPKLNNRKIYIAWRARLRKTKTSAGITLQA